MIIPPGGFFTYGLLLGFVNWFPGWYKRIFAKKAGQGGKGGRGQWLITWSSSLARS